MRIPGIGFSLALALLAASVANAAPPAAPQVTMGADVKLLRFDWEPVTGASYYQLRFRPGGSSVYQPLGERIPAAITQTETALPVHLQDWTRMRFIVAACNTDGCTNSTALNPRSLMLETIGYLKASNTDPGDDFGRTVTLSADGYTLAVGAFLEASNATGVNGDQSNNSSPGSGGVYVFRRRGNTWQQEAYLKAGVNQSQQFFGTDWFLGFRALALSADGNILAAGAGGEDIDSIPNAGAVYVFRRLHNVWSLMATLHAPWPSFQNYFENSFGNSVDISLDGRTLKISSVNPRDAFNIPQFRSHIFVRPANTWLFSATLTPSIPGDECYSTRLSGDGQTVVSSCVTRATNSPHIVTTKRVDNTWVNVAELPVNFYELRQPIALTPDGTLMALLEGQSGVVGIYRWNGGNWAREDGIARPGWDLAFNETGQLLAISDFTASEAGPGVSPIVMPGTATLGAVYLYARSDTGTWSLRNVVKSANPGFRDWFGRSVSLSASGRTLAVGAPGENGNATGIDGDRNNNDAPNAGAAYLY